MTVDTITHDGRARGIDHTATIVLDSLSRIPTPTTGALIRYDDPLMVTVRERIGAHTLTGLRVARFAATVLRATDDTGVTGLDRDAHWRRAIAVAALADALNERSNDPEKAEVVITAALLLDVGKLALASILPKSYARVCRSEGLRSLGCCRLEWTHFGLDHARVGRRLATLWNLPERVSDGIGMHEAAPATLRAAARFPKLAARVQLADMLAPADDSSPVAPSDPGHSAQLCALAELSDEAVHSIRAQSECRIDTWTTAFTPILRSGHVDARVSRFRSAVVEDSELRGPRSRVDSPPSARRVISHFADRRSTSDRPADVCRYIADDCAAAFRIDTAIAFVYDADQHLFHCGLARANERAVSMVVCPSETSPHPIPLPAGVADLWSGALIPPPPIAASVRERFRRDLCDALTLMLPIVHAGDLLGGVLLDAHGLTADRSEISDEIETMGVVYGVAVAHAIEREHLERANDALAAANIPPASDAREPGVDRTLETLAVTAAGAAHELNTPLAIIAGRAQMLARSTENPDDRRILETICENSHTCSRIVSELMSFAKPDPPQPAAIVLKTWLEQFRQRWRTRSQNREADFETELSDPSVEVFADADHLETVLAALVANAVASIPEHGGRLVINSRSRASDDTVVLGVVDNGRGMSSDVLERACDPFFSHRDAGRGRGLGLSIARRLVVLGGGRLWIESEPQVGTTVYVELPAHEPHRGESDAM